MPIGLTDYVQPLGSFPVAHEDDLLGSYRSVTDNAARDAIPAERRKQGMLVYTQLDGAIFVLGSGLTNSDWSLALFPPTGISIGTLTPPIGYNTNVLQLPYRSEIKGLAVSESAIYLPSSVYGGSQRVISRPSIHADLGVSAESGITGTIIDTAWFRTWRSSGGHAEYVLTLEETAGPTYAINGYTPGSGIQAFSVVVPDTGRLYVSGSWVFLITAATIQAYQDIDIGGATRVYTGEGGQTSFIVSCFASSDSGLTFEESRGGSEVIYVAGSYPVTQGYIYRFSPGDPSGTLGLNYPFASETPQGFAFLEDGQVIILTITTVGYGVIAARSGYRDGGGLVLAGGTSYITSGTVTDSISDGKYLYFLETFNNPNSLNRIDPFAIGPNTRKVGVPSPATIGSGSRVYFDGATLLVTCTNGYLWRVHPDTMETLSLQFVDPNGNPLGPMAFPPNGSESTAYVATSAASPNNFLYRLYAKDSTRETAFYQAGTFVGNARKLNLSSGLSATYDATTDTISVTAAGGAVTLRDVSGSTVTVLSSDQHLLVSSASGGCTLQLPASTAGYTVLISDVLGTASTDNLTIVPPLGDTIMGLSAFVISMNYGTATLRKTDTTLWLVI